MVMDQHGGHLMGINMPLPECFADHGASLFLIGARALGVTKRAGHQDIPIVPKPDHRKALALPAPHDARTGTALKAASSPRHKPTKFNRQKHAFLHRR